MEKTMYVYEKNQRVKDRKERFVIAPIRIIVMRYVQCVACDVQCVMHNL